MKFLFIDTYYSSFLKHFWRNNYDLINTSYCRQREKLLHSCFGTSDFYSFNLKKMGYHAEDVIANDEISQRQWAREYKMNIAKTDFVSKIQLLPLMHRFWGRPRWIQEIVLAQIKKLHPDIIYIQDLSILNPETLKKAKNFCKLIVGQIACPLPSQRQIRCFDLILTSFPHYVGYFRKLGIKSEYFKLAFEPRILAKIGDLDRMYDVSFIGSFTHYHREGTNLLKKVSKVVPINIWGQGLSVLSPLHKHFHGEVWGWDMYKILAQSKIVINRHISVASDYANNMRLYETMGMGAMLITDDKKNLSDLFNVGKEVITYKDSNDLIKKIQYYLIHKNERLKIAKAGQRRILKDHTYRIRMEELVKVIKNIYE